MANNDFIQERVDGEEIPVAPEHIPENAAGGERIGIVAQSQSDVQLAAFVKPEERVEKLVGAKDDADGRYDEGGDPVEIAFHGTT